VVGKLIRGERSAALVGLLVVVLIAGCVPAAFAAGPATPRPTPIVRSATALTLSQLVGQKLVVAMDGTTVPSPGLLGRIRRGEIGGVILFGRNVTTPTALRALTKQLQGAATAGGQLPLLIAVDQEGGSIKRIPWAPPTLSPPQMGADGRTSTAESQGAATGTALKGLGINVDLAPVADVPAHAVSFINKQGRAFSFNASVVSALTNAFAEGLDSQGVLPVMKHFPGLMDQAASDATVDRFMSVHSTLGYTVWVVEVLNSERGATSFAGFTGLMPPSFDPPFAHQQPLVEVGWRLWPQWWGLGIASEAARASVAHGFDVVGLPEIVSFTVVANTPSRAVMERIGMRYDSEFDHPRAKAGDTWRRHVLYRMAPEDPRG